MGKLNGNTLQLACLLIVIFFTQASDACDSGRIFVGSVNESFPEHVHRVGVYSRLDVKYQGLPVYKHESNEEYLYHIGGNLMAGGHWAVGSQVGGTTAAFSVPSDADTPDATNALWRVWVIGRQEWHPERRLRAKCVDAHFRSCTSGRIRLHGISSWGALQRHRMGEYTLTNQTHKLRPVYKHEGEDEYLFYTDGLWMIGPEVGQVTGGLFVVDYAWRPEFVANAWVVFSGTAMARDPNIKITCTGNKHNASEDLLPVPPMPPGQADSDSPVGLPGGSEGALPLGCALDLCANNSTCADDGDSFLCICAPGFFGLTCQQEIYCGPPPAIGNGHVTGMTGFAYQDVAFYACADEYVISDETGVVCGAGGEWSPPPECVHWFMVMTPTVPIGSRRPHVLEVAAEGAPRGRKLHLNLDRVANTFE